MCVHKSSSRCNIRPRHQQIKYSTIVMLAAAAAIALDCRFDNKKHFYTFFLPRSHGDLYLYFMSLLPFMLSIANSENVAIELPPPRSPWCVYVSWNASHKSLSESQCVWSKRFQSLTIIFSMRSNFNLTLSIENTTLKSNRFTNEILFWLRKQASFPEAITNRLISKHFRFDFKIDFFNSFWQTLLNRCDILKQIKRKKRAGKRVVSGLPRVLCLMLHIKTILLDI